jgi:6-phosphofructokinase
MGYPIVAVHVPKTVDNDLPITDSCPASAPSRSTSPPA